MPTASGIVKPSASTSAGTITNPPPTPKNPVSSPTNEPATTTLMAVARSKPDGGEPRWTTRRRRAAAAAPADSGRWPPGDVDRGVATSRRRRPASTPRRRAATRRRSTASFQCEPSNDPPMPARPNIAPAANRTRPARQCGIMPTSGGDGDQHQRGGRGGLRVLPGGVHERRHGEDRSAAAERAERQPDQESQRGRQQRAHRSIYPWGYQSGSDPGMCTNRPAGGSAAYKFRGLGSPHGRRRRCSASIVRS